MKKIAIIGLGYVGLPLAVEFGRKNAVVGFDINASRVAELNAGHDHTLETEDEDLQSVLSQGGSVGLELTNDLEKIRDAQIYIVTDPRLL